MLRLWALCGGSGCPPGPACASGPPGPQPCRRLSLPGRAQGVQDGVPSSRGYRGGFAASLMVKDLGLAATAAEHCGAPLPMAETAAELYS